MISSIEKRGISVLEFVPPKEREKKLRAVSDIDDLLVKAREGYVPRLNKRFGTQVNIAEVTGYVQDHPAWKRFGQELEEFMEKLRQDEGFNFNLEPVEGALEGTLAIAQIATIDAYVTIRPTTVYQATRDWFHLHGFPEEPALWCRPTWVPFDKARAWKADFIRQLHPDFVVEDDIEIAEMLGELTVFLVERPHNRGIKIKGSHIVQASWQEAPEKIHRLKESWLRRN